jgi:hypothetical protein
MRGELMQTIQAIIRPLIKITGTIRPGNGSQPSPPTPTGGGYVLSNIPVTIIQTEGASSS